MSTPDLDAVHIHDSRCDSLNRRCPADSTYSKRTKPCMATGPMYGPSNEQARPVTCGRMAHASGEHVGYGDSFRIVRWSA